MLVISLSNQSYKLYITKEIFLPNVVVLDKIKYQVDEESKNNKGFIGFFDWLRLNRCTIAGIRFCFFEHHPYNQFLKKVPYTKISCEGKCVEFMFEGDRYDPDLSGDQDFSNNYVYRSSKGSYLFTITTDHLTDIELNSLEKLCIKLNESDWLPSSRDASFYD